LGGRRTILINGTTAKTDTKKERRKIRSIVINYYTIFDFQFLDSLQCNPHAIGKIANQFIIAVIVNVFDRPNACSEKHATTNDTGIMGNIGRAGIA